MSNEMNSGVETENVQPKETDGYRIIYDPIEACLRPHKADDENGIKELVTKYFQLKEADDERFAKELEKKFNQSEKKDDDRLIRDSVKLQIPIDPSTFKLIAELAYDRHSSVEETTAALIEEDVDLYY